MNWVKTIIRIYSLVFAVIIGLGAYFSGGANGSTILIVFSPVLLYLLADTLVRPLHISFFDQTGVGWIKKTALYYSFIITTLMTITGFISAGSMAQVASAMLFMPMAIYFGVRVMPSRKKAIHIPEQIINPSNRKAKFLADDLESTIKVKEVLATGPSKELTKVKVDNDRRAFLKLIGSAGLSIFVFSLFTKKAEAAFFGSVPGPGTIGIKDTTGTLIDPAKNQPTDGYRISQLDDSSPAYYGFTNKDGNWFIMKEDSSGNYRYAKGSSSFATNWTGRAGLSYDYFDVVF